MDDLRLHPNYKSLPLPENVICNSPSDYWLYRQDSLEWNLLHQGRLTTSKLAACLGIYEPYSARKIDVPRGLTSHRRALGAYYHLLDDDTIPIENINMTFNNSINNNNSNQVDFNFDYDVLRNEKEKRNKKNNNKIKKVIYNPWHINTNKKYSNFAAIYQPKAWKFSNNRNNSTSKYRYNDANRARLAWGSAQEATAVLVSLNYLYSLSQASSSFSSSSSSSSSSQFMVMETGMCPLEATNMNINININLNGSISSSSSLLLKKISKYLNEGSLPPMGASPDGLIYDSNTGELMVLEVKCSSPFASSGNGGRKVKNNNKSKSNKAHSSFLRVMDRPLSKKGLGSWHVPQIMLEMLCNGPLCRAALLVQLSANNGAVIYKIPRDDAYIEMMLMWTRRFYKTYILRNNIKNNGYNNEDDDDDDDDNDFIWEQKNGPPSLDFFKGKDGYDDFLLKTKAIADNAEKLAIIPENMIQRNEFNTQYFLD